MGENNKIIAEFMGIQPIEAISDNTSKTYYYYNNSEMEDYEALPEYHSDWNWLMKVVEKIEKEFCSTNIHYYSQKQMYSVEFLGFNIEYDNSEYGDDKMKILYDSCVKFINFYNKQKEE